MKKNSIGSLVSNIQYPISRAARAFTLVEVLIVVGIIGLLASVVLSGLGSVRSRGRDARRVADLRQVQQGLELYYTREQEYPQITSGSGSWVDLKSVLEDPALGITKLSNDPKCRDADCGGENYQYGSDGQSYVLKAMLEDAESPLLRDSYEGGESGVTCSPGSGDYCVKF